MIVNVLVSVIVSQSVVARCGSINSLFTLLAFCFSTTAQSDVGRAPAQL